MADQGFTVRTVNVNNLGAVKQDSNVPYELQSCHTAIVDGYVIEGHVPAAEVTRLLAERPDILGLCVAGMPANSPGMEAPGAAAQPFDVVAFSADGTQTVFASYT